MKKITILFSYFSLLLLIACQTEEPKKNLTEEFVLEEGFKIEAVASESLLTSPVEIEFDDKGRIWVVEMTGYMRDVDGSDEKLPDGRISILEDTDGDGVMDNKKVFLDELIAPRALALVNNGLLYAEPPFLWWTPIINDKPGTKQVVDSLYANGGNIEHMPNGLLYNLDNWIYSSKSDRRYRYRKGKWEIQATFSKGQWGLTSDDEGRLYYNDNSNPIYTDFVQSNQVNSNPHLKNKYIERKNIASSRRLFPIIPNFVNRGYNEGVIDEEGKVVSFTSACGPLIYQGEQFRKSHYQNAFACGPEGNLVKRFELERVNGKVAAKFTSDSTEFLASKDPTFRPVNLNTGPDGALYVVDMRRAIIQHRAFMTSYLKDKILSNGLDTLPITGRIFRVLDEQNEIKKRPDLSNLSLAEWIPLLQSPNAWSRIKAQEKLVFANDKSLIPDISAIAKNESNPLGQIHALWTLEGMGALSNSLLVEIGAKTKQSIVLSQIILLAKTVLNKDNETALLPIFENALRINQYQPQLQVAHTVGQSSNPAYAQIWLDLANKYADDPILSEALVSSIAGKEQALLQKINSQESKLAEILKETITNIKEGNQFVLKINNRDRTDGRTKGFELFQHHCGVCHGMDGKGIANLAPPIYQSEYANGPVEHLVLILLNGLEGPITVHGKPYEGAAVMPGIKNNPEMTDKNIQALISFIRSGLSNVHGGGASVELVAKLRKETADREKLFTEEELKAWPIEK